MKTYLKLTFLFAVLIYATSCGGDKKPVAQANKSIILKGLYSYGPEVRSFTDCEESKDYWVIDSAKTLELAYSDLGFEKPYTPVYVEVECQIIKSDTTVTGNYDSTMVVTKLNKISKQIPEGPCNQ